MASNSFSSFCKKYLELYRNPETIPRDLEIDFAEECIGLGFEMDAREEFVTKYGREAFDNHKELKSRIDEIDDIMILGKAVFSKWRYYTHWAQTDLTNSEAREWFITALERLDTIVERKRIYGFQPIVNNDSRVLLVGSLPGKASLERKMYYADRGNYFWKFLAMYVGAEFPETDESKRKLLKKSGVGLWDVYESGIRINKKTSKKTSSDSDITDVVYNDIAGFLEQHPEIKRVGATGSEAYNALRKMNLKCEVVKLPSTSGSNGGQWGNKNISEPIDVTRKGWIAWTGFLR